MSHSFEHMVEMLMVFYDMTFQEARNWYEANERSERLEELVAYMESGLNISPPITRHNHQRAAPPTTKASSPSTPMSTSR